MLAVSERSPVDLLWGIGGTPEGVLSAAALKSMGGQLLGRLWPRDDGERQAAIDAGYDLDRVLTADDLCSGEDVFFSATGVTDGDVLQGVRYRGPGATTESLVMRSAPARSAASTPATIARSCAPSSARNTAEDQASSQSQAFLVPSAYGISPVSCSSWRRLLITAPASSARLSA